MGVAFKTRSFIHVNFYDPFLGKCKYLFHISADYSGAQTTVFRTWSQCSLHQYRAYISRLYYIIFSCTQPFHLAMKGLAERSVQTVEMP